MARVKNKLPRLLSRTLKERLEESYHQKKKSESLLIYKIFYHKASTGGDKKDFLNSD